jgi:hypothetical protein
MLNKFNIEKGTKHPLPPSFLHKNLSTKARKRDVLCINTPMHILTLWYSVGHGLRKFAESLIFR